MSSNKTKLSISPDDATLGPNISLRCWTGNALFHELPRLIGNWQRCIESQLHHHPAWLLVIKNSLHHDVFLIEATIDGQTVGCLSLAFVKSALFGKFLVSLPYLSSAGAHGSDSAALTALVDGAVELAEQLDVQYLELRHETACQHRLLNATASHKVHMRLPLPSSSETLWAQLTSKVRNQIRKAERFSYEVRWGQQDRLTDFYDVFSRNMRDLGTPSYSRKLFREVIEQFPTQAEICTVHSQGLPIAAAIVLHTAKTEVPSASSLRQYNQTNVNMLMYWQLLQRAIERGSREFDFGRSTIGSNTFRFKSQWGAIPRQAVWQYYVRHGDHTRLQKESGRYASRIALWKRMPVWLTRFFGPWIAAGLP